MGKNASGRPAQPLIQTPIVSNRGSIIKSADLENVGYAEVYGFYRFPCFEPRRVERCQQGYSAFQSETTSIRRSFVVAVSFASNIRPLFRDSPDVDSMQGYGLDLSSYEEVKAKALEVYARLENGSMPCDEAWPKERLEFFKQWMDEGSAP
jgi:hypothetical protein